MPAHRAGPRGWLAAGSRQTAWWRISDPCILPSRGGGVHCSGDSVAICRVLCGYRATAGAGRGGRTGSFITGHLTHARQDCARTPRSAYGAIFSSSLWVHWTSLTISTRTRDSQQKAHPILADVMGTRPISNHCRTATGVYAPVISAGLVDKRRGGGQSVWGTYPVLVCSRRAAGACTVQDCGHMFCRVLLQISGEDGGRRGRGTGSAIVGAGAGAHSKEPALSQQTLWGRAQSLRRLNSGERGCEEQIDV